MKITNTVTLLLLLVLSSQLAFADIFATQTFSSTTAFSIPRMGGHLFDNNITGYFANVTLNTTSGTATKCMIYNQTGQANNSCLSNALLIANGTFVGDTCIPLPQTQLDDGVYYVAVSIANNGTGSHNMPYVGSGLTYPYSTAFGKVTAGKQMRVGGSAGTDCYTGAGSDGYVLKSFTFGFVSSVPPKFTQSSYNLTTAVSNDTAWRNSTSQTILTRDTTPTVTFNTDISSHCRINKASGNWTDMGNSRNCTSTESTAHTCTLAAADALAVNSGVNYLYLACTDATRTAYNQTGGLNTTLDLYYINGTVTGPGSAALEGVNMTAISHPDYTVYDRSITSAAGVYSLIVYAGNWSVIAVDSLNLSRVPGVQSHVRVP